MLFLRWSWQKKSIRERPWIRTWTLIQWSRENEHAEKEDHSHVAVVNRAPKQGRGRTTIRKKKKITQNKKEIKKETEEKNNSTYENRMNAK